MAGPLVSPEEARAQVRGDAADDASLALYARAAERAVMNFLNRKVYATQEELDDAQAQAALDVSVVETSYEDAREAAYALESVDAREAALRVARQTYERAKSEIVEIERGIVVEDDIKVGVLLVLGHLFRNREATSTDRVQMIELGAYQFLWPYRVGLGV